MDREALIQEFANDFVLNIDLVSRSYCGYWLRRVATLPNGASIAWEQGESSDEVLVADEDGERFARLYRKGSSPTLPKRFFIIDSAVARSAYEIGERLWGKNWMYEADANHYDVVMQRALLGVVRYG
jgi:hypothetical protein